MKLQNCLYQHSTKRGRNSTNGDGNKCQLRGAWYGSCLCQRWLLTSRSSDCVLRRQHPPSEASPLEGLLFGVLHGDKQPQAAQRPGIAAEPRRDSCINGLLLGGFSCARTEMPNSIWTEPWDRKSTLFPGFTAGKTFEKVFIKYFRNWIKNPPLLSVAAWSSQLMHETTLSGQEICCTNAAVLSSSVFNLISLFLISGKSLSQKCP